VSGVTTNPIEWLILFLIVGLVLWKVGSAATAGRLRGLMIDASRSTGGHRDPWDDQHW
jgi:hypothetical protein